MKFRLLVFALFCLAIVTAKADYIFEDWDVSVPETAIYVDEQTGDCFLPETAVRGWQTSSGPTAETDIHFCPGDGVSCRLKISNGRGWSWIIIAEKTDGGPDMITHAI